MVPTPSVHQNPLENRFQHRLAGAVPESLLPQFHVAVQLAQTHFEDHRTKAHTMSRGPEEGKALFSMLSRFRMSNWR